MKRVRWMVGVTLAAASVLTAVFALQGWRYPETAARQDALLERQPEHAWEGDRGLVEELAGARDDALLRRAVALFRVSRPDVRGGNKTSEQVVAGLESALLLTRIARGGGSTDRRSRAANLAGILLAEDAVFEPDGGLRVARAAQLFRQAIRLDPANDAAKTNLELVYAYSGAESSAADDGGGFGGFGNDAGAGEAGSGY
jgi:hypothetical protein